METQLEIEFKMLIEDTMYTKILEDYQTKITNTYQQTNYYLSHPILDDLKYMLRIREKENTYELTLKQKAKVGNIETNCMITKEIKEQICNHEFVDNEIFTILKQYDIDPTTLQCHVSLTTLRSDILLPEGILSLDKNSYLGMEDYEIEFEVQDFQTGKEAFLKLIEPYGLIYTTNCSSKIQRVKKVLSKKK